MEYATMKELLCTAMLILLAAAPAVANDKAKLMDELSGYLEFVDYGGGTIFAEQIPKSEYSKMMIIDARDSAQFAKVLAKSSSIPKDKAVLIYCNTGSLSAQAGFALRVSGWENVKILQGGYAEWKAKGGLDANARASGAVPKH
jgi:rhodanese-related sulfurtransferase